MNKSVAHRILKHASNGGRGRTFVPGNGFSLTSATACVYLLDADGMIIETLLETAPGEDVGEAAEFFAQQVVLAQRPSDRMMECGIAGFRGGALVVTTYFEGVCLDDRKVLEERILSLSKNPMHLCHGSNWEGFFA